MYKIINIFEPVYSEEGLKTLIFKVSNADIDIVSAVKAATAEYLATDDGREALDVTGGGFNWYDVDVYLPVDLCKKHGFLLVGKDTEVIVVNPRDLVIDSELKEGESNDAI